MSKGFNSALPVLALVLAQITPTPVLAQQGGQGWRALCIPGNEIEILVGGDWYRGSVIGPDEFGDEYCSVMTTAYTGREMQFAMAPERMQAVQVPGVPGPRTGPAPKPGAPAPEQQAWRALCVPGSEVEILIGSAWYKSIVIGPNEFGEAECGVLNTSYAGSELRFAMAPDRMRAVQAPLAAAPAVAPPPAGPDLAPAPTPAVPQAPVQAAAPALPPPNGRPPLGRYVCRQYMTTIGWIDLGAGTYRVNTVEGGYSYDPANGLIGWQGGAYAGWPARYEFSPAGAGHAFDEHIIRMTDEGGDLKIDCFLTAG